VHGVLLRTDSPAEVRTLAQALQAMQQASVPALHLEAALVTHVAPAGMGECVCDMSRVGQSHIGVSAV
jgi:3-dehydroquinate synthase class II